MHYSKANGYFEKDCSDVLQVYLESYLKYSACEVCGVYKQIHWAAFGIYTCRPFPLLACRLQRPRLPLGVVPQLLMIWSCFSARSARSKSSSMNCCKRTLALASRAAVSWRNWSIWATSLDRDQNFSEKTSLTQSPFSIQTLKSGDRDTIYTHKWDERQQSERDSRLFLSCYRTNYDPKTHQ